MLTSNDIPEVRHIVDVGQRTGDHDISFSRNRSSRRTMLPHSVKAIWIPHGSQKQDNTLCTHTHTHTQEKKNKQQRTTNKSSHVEDRGWGLGVKD